jgi:hypothetical protein
MENSWNPQIDHVEYPPVIKPGNGKSTTIEVEWENNL